MRVPTNIELEQPGGVARYMRELIAELPQAIDAQVRLNVQPGTVDGQRPTNPTATSYTTPQHPVESTSASNERFRTEIGLTQLATAKHNKSGASDPDPNIDNASLGYGFGSFWVNLAATPIPTVWFCVDATNEFGAWSKLN